MKQNRKKNTNKFQNPGYTIRSMRDYTSYEGSNLTFLDPHKYIPLKYKQTLSLSMLTLVGTQYIFRLNSIFDPDVAVGGHQPYGYDTIATLYNRYRTLKTKFKVVFGTATNTFHFVVLPINGALSSAITDQTTFETASESPRAISGMQTGGGPPITVTRTISLNDLNGVTRTEYLADDRFEAQIGANPAEVMQLYIGVYNSTASTVTALVAVELTYYVDLHDPLPLAGS